MDLQRAAAQSPAPGRRTVANAAKSLGIAMIILAASAHAWAQETPTQLRSLLARAIDAPDGRASAVVTGNIQEFFRRAFRSDGPVIAEVSTLHALPQEGCKRFNVRLSMPGATIRLAEGEAPRPFTLDMGINYCRDGSAPQAIGSNNLNPSRLP